MNKSNKNNLYLDYPFSKQTNKNGELKTFTNSDALFQAIKIWLSCEKGEKIRSDGGGYISPFLGKTLDDKNANEMKNSIQFGLTQEFSPLLIITKLEVVPNVEKDCWVIYIAGYNDILNIGVNDYVIIKNN